MRSLSWIGSLAFVLSSSSEAQLSIQHCRHVPGGLVASASCNPQATGALAARVPYAKSKPRNHTILSPAFRFLNASYVQGRCVPDIQFFNVGVVFLSSSESLVLQENGAVKYYPPGSLPERHGIAIDTIAALPGYRLVTADKIQGATALLGNQIAYIGIFKSKSDHVIARFDVRDGKASKEADILLRARDPIESIDYLPFVDVPLGQIGFVTRDGTDKAWLYRYDWHHGPLKPLAF